MKLSYFLLVKLKTTAKNATDITLRLSSYMRGIDKSNVPLNLLLMEAFSNKLSMDIKLSKYQLFKIIHTVSQVSL